MQYNNTRETAGSVIEVSHYLKTKSGRTVKVLNLTEKDQRMLESIDLLWYGSYGAVKSFSPDIKLEVEVLYDTFREGLVGKLVNLKEVHAAWEKAHKEALNGVH